MALGNRHLATLGLLALLLGLALDAPAEIKRHVLNTRSPASAMLLGDAQHTGRSGNLTPNEDLRIAWRVQLPSGSGPSGVTATPVQDGFGTLYVVSLSGIVAAYDPDGTLLWSRALEASPTGGPTHVAGSLALDGAGALFIAAYEGTVWSLDTTDGSVLWRVELQPEVFASPMVVGDRVYVSAQDTTSALSRHDGTLLWTFTAQTSEDPNIWSPTGTYNSTPAVAPDGTVVVGSWSGLLYALEPDTGLERWRAYMWDYQVSAPCVDDEHVYVVVRNEQGNVADSQLRAYDLETGQQLWSHTELGNSFTFPSLHPEGYVVTAELHDEPLSSGAIKGTPNLDISGRLHAIHPDGTPAFISAVPGEPFYGSVTFDGTGRSVAVSANGTLVVLTPRGWIDAWLDLELPMGSVRATPIIGLPQGDLSRLYVVGGSGELVAVEGSSVP